EDVSRKHSEVGELSTLERAEILLDERGEGRAVRISSQSLLNSDALFREPAIRVLAIERSSNDGGIDPGERIEWRDGPIGAEGERGLRVEKRSEGIGGRAPLCSDAAFGPAAIVDRMVRLH